MSVTSTRRHLQAVAEPVTDMESLAFMPWYAWVGIVVGAVLLLSAYDMSGRVVFEDVPRSRLFTRYLDYWLLGGPDGGRVLIYHRPAGILIEVLKSLSPPRAVTGKVGLRLYKVRMEEPSRFRRGREGWTTRWLRRAGQSNPGVITWVWRLPKRDSGKVELAVDCGDSLTRVHEVIEEIISQEPEVSSNPVFAVWGEGRSWGMCGKFAEGLPSEISERLRGSSGSS